ncbi:hypothetical protein BDY21DRAFT_343463 [Lineolata rhizophorae]|uniref:FAR1 domain-containing protein n=1 Tax=Lineolata rhizophorae TaxID=578093 RepID=A0A6A6P2D3_9PEZI|nr:hypothetical protein BDY21DRAFT_343463 [Lineolata rhizophorae]
MGSLTTSAPPHLAPSLSTHASHNTSTSSGVGLEHGSGGNHSRGNNGGNNNGGGGGVGGSSNVEWDMAPPPEGMYPSKDALLQAAQNHAAQHGYALSINNYWKTQQRVKIACVCYGTPKNTRRLTDATRVRKGRGSLKTGCRMWVEGKMLPNEGDRWRLTVKEPRHNHPGVEAERLSVHRKRTQGEAVERWIRRLWKENKKANETVDILKCKFPGVRITLRDVYNARAKITRKIKEGADSDDDDDLGANVDDSHMNEFPSGFVGSDDDDDLGAGTGDDAFRAAASEDASMLDPALVGDAAGPPSPPFPQAPPQKQQQQQPRPPQAPPPQPPPLQSPQPSHSNQHQHQQQHQRQHQQHPQHQQHQNQSQPQRQQQHRQRHQQRQQHQQQQQVQMNQRESNPSQDQEVARLRAEVSRLQGMQNDQALQIGRLQIENEGLKFEKERLQNEVVKLRLQHGGVPGIS